MRILRCFLASAVLFSAGCGKKEEKKQKYNIIKEHGSLLGSRTSSVESQYLSVLEKDPKNLNALIKLGNHYFDTGQPGKSVEMYQRALKLNPNDANVRTDMGVMYRKMGKFDEAIVAFRMAGKSNPRHVQSRYNLGIVYYYDKKDRVKAADAWEEVLKINPSHPEAVALRKFINDVRIGTIPNGIPSRNQKGDGWIQ
jgi:tetratricopeptide (TPR) repeat protein